MNLQVQLDEVTAIPAADDVVAQVLADARLADEAALLDAVDARRVQINLSLAALDQLAGLAVGHASKCLSPARLKRPTTGTLYALLDALALSIVLVVDGTKVSRISPAWRPRDQAHVRQCALSPTTIARARPVVLAELVRRAARPRWANVPAKEFMRAMAEAST
jgi:hypothetical protein